MDRPDQQHLVPGRAAAAAALGLAGAGTTGTAAALLLAETGAQLAATGSRAPLPEVVPVLATAAAALVTGWLGVVLLLGAVAALPPRPGLAGGLPHLARRLAPRLAPRAAALLTGCVVAASGATAAHAVPVTPPAAAGPVGPVGSAIPVTWVDRPAEQAGANQAHGPATVPRPDLAAPSRAGASTAGASAAGATRDGTRPSPAGAATVVVQRGDTLWDLAAARLPGEPTAADIARAWPRWYAANRDVIGEDPHLLLPGQRLQPPEAGASAAPRGADR